MGGGGGGDGISEGSRRQDVQTVQTLEMQVPSSEALSTNADRGEDPSSA